MHVRANRSEMRAVAREVQWEFAQSTYAPLLGEVPAALFAYWARTAHHDFPAIPRDASFFVQSMEGLMNFFDCASAASRPCALPSRAADAVWQAWTRMDGEGLARFCIRHVGRPIARASAEHGDIALAACLVQARRRASRPVAGPHLPALFSLDVRLGMPHGAGYRLIGGLVACAPLDELGHPCGPPAFPPALAPRALFEAGLVDAAEYAQAARS